MPAIVPISLGQRKAHLLLRLAAGRHFIRHSTPSIVTRRRRDGGQKAKPRQSLFDPAGLGDVRRVLVRRDSRVSRRGWYVGRLCGSKRTP